MNGEVSPDDGSTVDDRIDERCDAFELAWRSGQRPSIVDYIRPEDESHRKKLFCELLLVELECRRSLGEQPTEEEYVRDFPGFAADIYAAKFRHGATAFATTRVSNENRPQATPKQRSASGLPIRTSRVGIAEQCWRWICRRPAMAGGALLVVVSLVAASMTIAFLQNRNRRLTGFRPVRITTTPSGARVALVPLDPKTNEPDPNLAGVVRPRGTTPLTTELKAGTYLVEAVLPGGETPNFAEVYRTVLDSGRVPAPLGRRNEELGLDPDTCLFHDIAIMPPGETLKKMVQIQIPEDLRKQNPSLPERLYVDERQTTPDVLVQNPEFQPLLRVGADGSSNVSYPSAVKWAELSQTRLASSAEYDAMTAAVEKGQATLVGTGAAVTMDDLFDDFPELTTTTKTDPNIRGIATTRDLASLHVLKGFGKSITPFELLPWAEGLSLAGPDAESPKISIRGVRSAAPRFVKP